jgi:galactolipid galactosyltransferase
MWARRVLYISIFISSLGSAADKDFHFSKDFMFGLATAPAHVEDQLDDVWLDFAKHGKVAAISGDIHPEERLQFWAHPEKEIDLAAATGIHVFRLGIDWGRLAPNEPGSLECHGPCPMGVQNRVALQKYKLILKSLKKKNIKVMLTLFHHSIPKWALKNNGWAQETLTPLFEAFAMDVIRELHSDVDYWITFNEPTIYGLLTHVTGTWPPGHAEGLTSLIDLDFYRGDYAKAMRNMQTAHRYIYLEAHKEFSNIQIGFAHHFSYFNSVGLLGPMIVNVANELFTWSFPDRIKDDVDFVGMNYYGAEYPQLMSNTLQDGVEYSEAGRAIYPIGFYRLLKQINERYKKPIFITENGIADATDSLRPSYLIEHLAALHQAMSEDVNVLGYIFWTISDNWEWADGYCPKFGLVAVDRENDFHRTPRPSYYLFKEIVTNKVVTESQRTSAWHLVEEHFGKPRPFCRAEDGVGSFNAPNPRLAQKIDWRFHL